MNDYILVFECDGIEYIFNSHNVEIKQDEVQIPHNGMYYTQPSPFNNNIVVDIDTTNFTWSYLADVMNLVNATNYVNMNIMSNERLIKITHGVIESIEEKRDRFGSFIQMNIIYDYYTDVNSSLVDIRRKKILKLLNKIKKGTV